MPSYKPLHERFWSYVDKTDTCWLWRGSKNANGYGQLSETSGREKPKSHRAHRLSWELHYGAIPPGLCVLHRCDSPACVNPDHLFLGSQRENMHDMIRKGRKARVAGMVGEDNPAAKITREDAELIRSSPLSGVELARQYGLTPAMISRIRLRKAWA